jgi:tRNA-uridine 2-sulfurtransferase
MFMKAKVLVGMSGGVDSSVAAALLIKEGYEVIGLTMKTWTEDCSTMHQEKCCGPKAITDVRSVADRLGIPCYVLSHEEEFKKTVIDYFVSEYKKGRTPNPCVVCNDKLKFGTVLSKARELGAQFVATGHYAVVDHSKEATGGRTLLRRGADEKKDQSYFLFNLTQGQLRSTLFPVGTCTKEETRKIAKDLGLRTHNKPDSHEICFVPDDRYGNFLKTQAGVSSHVGAIVDEEGKQLGEHEGVEFYTIGQRKGLRIADKAPYYVTGLSAETNTVLVGRDEDLFCPGLIASRPNWVEVDSIDGPVECEVKIRYNAPAVRAAVELDKDLNRVRVRFEEKQRAISPGQAVVFYQGEVVLGGAWIERSQEA